MADSILDRRKLLQIMAGTAAVTGVGAAALPRSGSGTSVAPDPGAVASKMPALQGEHSEHGDLFSMVGDVDIKNVGFDPMDFLTDFDYGQRVFVADDGVTVREWDIVAVDREIEIAPGVFYPAWTYNGRVPGPTLRCNEGDRLRINFVNNGSHPHTLHFHGIHRASMDGVAGFGRGEIHPGDQFVYEFNAKPYGCHLYHCHAIPLKRHIHKGLYGAFIINPDPLKHGDAARSRHPDYPESEEFQEFVMVMNGFDTNFDSANEIYAVNTVAFHYMKHPIPIDRNRPVRIYLSNLLEFDLINSFHLHANFFDYYDHGTQLEPTLRTVDTISQMQGQRGILEFSFKDVDFEPGPYMFHAHVSEFAELGWMSMFDVQ